MSQTLFQIYCMQSMDLELKLPKPTPNASIRVPKQTPSLIIASPTKKNALPPISSENTAAESKVSTLLLEQCKGEVEQSMKHLLTEAQSAENRIQQGIDGLWQRMLDIIHQKSQEMERKCLLLKNELEESKSKIARLTNQEAALVQHNAKTSVQLTSEEKKRLKLEEEIVKLKMSLDVRQKSLQKSNAEALENTKSLSNENEVLQGQLQQKDTMLKEYQSKIMKLTDRINKLSKDLSSEKTTSEKHQKSTSDLLAQQTSENRKLLLELSKLKNQLASVNSSLASKKEENKQLELQIKTEKNDHELTVARLDKEHKETVKELQTQIAALKSQLEKLQVTYVSETENLKKQIVEAHRAIAEIAASSCARKDTAGDDYLEARIKFLQHQNKQEKVKLNNHHERTKN